MRKIEKHEPIEWILYRKQPNASFDSDGSVEAKKKLRQALMKDQGYLCAYCQRSIVENPDKGKFPDTRIEHVISQEALKEDTDGSRYGGLNELSYGNLVVCCDGNISGTKYGHQDARQFHCDRSKGNRLLRFNPFTDEFLSSLSYTSDGRVRSSNDDWNEDLEKVLNLNHPRLCSNRKAVLQALIKMIPKWNRKRLESVLELYENKDSKGCYNEYNGMVVWNLRRWMRKSR